MSIVNEYFIKKTENISFIELKKGSFINLNDYIIKDYIPLPIIIDTLIDEIKVGNMSEELNVRHLIDGIIYTLGTDLDFKYKKEYKDILYNYNEKIEDYIIYKGLKFMENKNMDYGAIYFRSLVNINPRNVNGLFNYALCLESMALDLMKNKKEDKGQAFLQEATYYLETLLEIDENFSLAYYKLGYYYKNKNQFLKASLTWEKFLQLDKSQERLEEIREELQLIEDDAKYEQGIYHLNSGEYDLAIEEFLKLISRYNDWGHLYYLIGLAYKEKSDFKKAINFLEKAQKLERDKIDICIELGICYYSLGELDSALEVFNKGVELEPENYKIIFNRGIINLELGLIEDGVKDIEEAYKLNPRDEMVKQQREALDKYLT